MGIKSYIEFENTVRFITNAFPNAEKLVKPTLLHSIRVGLYLFNDGYSREIYIAGLLHDLLEDTRVTKDELIDKYGIEITELVEANSKNQKLSEEEIYSDLINRCIKHSQDALIVKVADVIDNLQYFRKLNDIERVNKMTRIGNLIIDSIPGDKYKDRIFDELEKLLK